jgi:hypothetical protein
MNQASPGLAPDRSELTVRDAARELISRHGLAACGIARERVARLERAAQWRDHAIALRVLTAVERMLSAQP